MEKKKSEVGNIGQTTCMKGSEEGATTGKHQTYFPSLIGLRVLFLSNKWGPKCYFLFIFFNNGTQYVLI